MKLRILSATFISLLSAGAVCAAPVGRADALSSARKFFVDHGLRANFNNDNPTRSQADSNQAAPYYIFNIENNGGYIIIAGDDRAKTVLAYSLSGNLDENLLPESCEAWLRQYAEEIASIPQDYHPTRSSIEYPDVAVTPLVKSQWNQDYPFNLETPLAPNGNHYPAGCVATSVGQIMYYYQYPERGVGKVSYEDRKDGATLSIDFADYPAFDWAQMLDKYSTSSPAESCQAVASLMKGVGYACKMQYNNTSTALHTDAMKALINNFGYDPNIHYYQRARMSDQEWIDILLTELTEGRPVLYDGRNPGGGHSFLCDGYDGAGYFHFNWGWGGLSDGYYSLSALNPGAQSTGGTGSGYSLSQTIMCRIAPPGRIESKPQTDYVIDLYSLSFRSENGYSNAADVGEVVTDAEYASMYIYVYNKALPDFSGEVCAATIEDGKITPVLTRDVKDLGVFKYTGLSFPISETTLGEGTHRVGFFYRKDTDDSWKPVIGAVTYPSECTVKIEGDKVTMSVDVPVVSLEMEGTLSHSILQINSSYTWNYTLANTGDIRFEGYAGVALTAVNDPEKAYFFLTPCMLTPDATSRIELKGRFSNIQEGEYYAIPYYTTSSNPDMSSIIPLTRPQKVVINAISVFSAQGTFVMQKADQTLALSVFNFGQTPWEGVIEGEIIKADGTVGASFISPEVKVGPNQNITTTLKGSDIDLSKGTYTLKLYAGPGRDNMIGTLPLIVNADMAGVEAVEAEAPSITVAAGVIRISSASPLSAVSLYDIAGTLCRNISNPGHEVEIDATTLPGGIYILKTITADGKSEAVKVRL